MSTRFLLRPGDTGPIQSTPVTCGAACLTVARMLADPSFATWVRTGEGCRPEVAEATGEVERFAAWERLVHERTTALRPAGHGLSVPWPPQLGTPPWGAKRELEDGASAAGTVYHSQVLREETRARLRARHAHLLDVVVDGEPALLYVGSPVLPRHVVLLLRPPGARGVAVYDPGTGLVSELDPEAFASRRLRLSGWDVPWLAVQPSGSRRVRLPAYRLAGVPARPSRATSAGAFGRCVRAVSPWAASRPGRG